MKGKTTNLGIASKILTIYEHLKHLMQALIEFAFLRKLPHKFKYSVN